MRNLEASREYHREYWRRHSDKLNQRRRERYVGSPEYLAKKAAYMRDHLAAKRQNDPSYVIDKRERDRLYRQTPEGNLSRRRQKYKRRALGGRHTLNSTDMQRLLTGFAYCCAYCLQCGSLTMDHFIPLTRGGGTVMGNIVPACSPCNSSKQNKMPSDWCTPEQLERVTGILGSL